MKTETVAECLARHRKMDDAMWESKRKLFEMREARRAELAVRRGETRPEPEGPPAGGLTIVAGAL